MDLPNLTIAPKGLFCRRIRPFPFSYQGVTNSNSGQISAGIALAFTSNNGYVREWLYNPGGDLADGNPGYDTVALPADFNDFFFRRTGCGPHVSAHLLLKGGALIDALIFGTGGAAAVLPAHNRLAPAIC